MSTLPKNILIVEDDEVNLMIAEHTLSKAGYRVSSANNGEQAIRMITEHAFDLILMDIEMPLMDGLEATPVIRAISHAREVPIIALTAHTIPEKLAEIREAGMDDYLIKPLELAKFEVIAQKYLTHTS